ncbi:hypothetical protein tpqmel_0369 [Candidatus Gastranaerophilus sp. (ex Termes propinquus)]|nr:hypothetical protein tpqmel_0369 [Candidatus Gastranaerophilus sp. (ex Termes propinquus)]
MKKLVGTLAAAAVFGMMAVAPASAEPVFGLIYKDATEVFGGSSNIAPAKVGTATCTSYFAVVGLGSCGIKDAMDQGKIKSLAFYDVHTKNIVGFKKVTVKAYGQ